MYCNVLGEKMKNKTIESAELLGAINQIVEIRGGSIALKENINAADLLSLKKAISPINNYITQKLTAQFVKKLQDIFPDEITDDVVTALLQENNTVNVNANGYDFVLKKEGLPRVIAEIKANIPYGGDRYGAAQKNGIIKDIEGLLRTKTKGKDIGDINTYFRFLVLLAVEDAEYSSFAATESLLENIRAEYTDTVIQWSDTMPMCTDKVYVVLLSIM